MEKHWSVDIRKLQKNSRAFAIWKLEERINHGIGDKKIKKKDLLKYWDEIDIDPFKRRALQIALL